MTYTSIVEMAGSQSLQGRIVAAVANEGVPDPMAWTQTRVWAIVAHEEGWATAWDYARDTSTLDDNPDTGARPGVISDTMITSAVQAVIAQEQPTP